ncbi:ABC transporter substrate-binding protein [Feifania hominis]|uniref:ABC transporter substrate-binding protein n=1 Tax=Feifania hominis TaxID=2763660 RepID=A0A926DCH4_9FIRM|nr:ABC transporter substrate-binding protein [Feifania hominis]MBC8536048.1 ABC transporter substrate-binding protein [Feifania hominis]
MKKLLAILLALAMVFSLAACSNNSDNPPTSGDNQGTDDPQGGGEVTPLKIVYCGYSLSGESGDRAKGVLEIARDQINAAGGVNGVPVEVEFIDGGADQQAYIDAYLKAVEVDGVSAIIGTFFSQYALACADYANEAKIPTFNVATNFEMAEACDYYYTNRCVDTAFSNVMAQIAIDNGVTNPVTLFYNTSNGYNDSAFMKAYMEKEGYTVAEEIAFDNTNTTDYTSIVLQAMNVKDSDGILLHATANTDGQSIITLLHEYDYKFPIVSNSNLFADSFVANTGAEPVEGLLGFAEYATTLDRPEIAAFEKMLQDGGFKYDTTGWADASFYDDFCLIVEAAKIAGANDKDSVNEGLKQIKGLKGVMTDYSYHDDHSFADNIYLATYTDGKVDISETLDVVH